MSLYHKSVDRYSYNPTNPLGLRHQSLEPCEEPNMIFPLRFSRRNISVNGNYPGRFIIGDYDRVEMIPPDMTPKDA